MKPALGRVGDAGQHIGEPSLRIYPVELGCHDQRRDRRSPIGTALRAGEQPGATAESKASQARSAALFIRQIRPSSRKRMKAGQRRSMESIGSATAAERDRRER